jgi:predicted metal-dependent hydrolase
MNEGIEMNTLQIGDRQVPYKVRESPDSRHVHLKLRPNLELEVLVPAVSEIDVRALLKKKRSWIEAKYDEIVKSKRVFDGTRLLYRGKPHEVKFAPSSDAVTKHENGRVTIKVDEGVERRSALYEWMKTETEKLVRKRLTHYSKKLRLSFNSFSVQETKKWAYCTKNRKLVFNWQLSALPKNLSDYVILHELTHLGEFSHSRRFKYLLAAVCPDFKERESMLKFFITS